MRWVIILAALPLAGCGPTAAEKAEKSYSIIGDSILGNQDRCRMAGKIKQAYLDEGNRHKFELWQATEYVDCSRAARGG